MKYPTVLFDLDGTLINTFDAVYQTHLYIASLFGYALPARSDEKRLMSGSLPDILRSVYQTDDQKTMEILCAFRSYYVNTAMQNAKLYPGISSLLETCRAKEVKTAVCTMGSEEQAISSMKNWGIHPFFDFICGINELSPTPKWQTIERILSLFGQPERSHVLLIGDSFLDGLAAQKTGICFLAAAYGSCYDKEEFQKIPNVFEANSVYGIQKFLFE